MIHLFQKHKDACNICFQNFASKQHLEAHITTAHTLSDFRKKYRCVICDISFSKNTSRLEKPSKLIKHMKSEHNIGYKCPICKMKLPSNLTLKLHNSQEHKAVITDHLCSKCGKSFKLKKSLEYHVSNNCSDQMRGNKCSICGETFESRFLNMEHVAAKHTSKSFSEALILASTNPQYDKRLF